MKCFFSMHCCIYYYKPAYFKAVIVTCDWNGKGYFFFFPLKDWCYVVEWTRTLNSRLIRPRKKYSMSKIRSIFTFKAFLSPQSVYVPKQRDLSAKMKTTLSTVCMFPLVAFDIHTSMWTLLNLENCIVQFRVKIMLQRTIVVVGNKFVTSWMYLICPQTG